MPKPTNLRIKTLTGTAIAPYLSELAKLRIEVFREWPYIYDGAADYEAGYLQTYIDPPEAAVIVAFDGEDVIGAATCLPLEAEPLRVRHPFITHGLKPEEYFYFGESVLRKQYRGHGIGVRFFQAREAQARRFDHYKYAAFCAVQRPNDHALRPSEYTPLDAFWGKRGYTKQPHLQCKMSWLDVGEIEETEKPLTFWTKPL